MINTTGIITTFAGNGPLGYLSGGFGGDGGAATAALINFPNNISRDVNGNIYVTD